MIRREIEALGVEVDHSASIVRLLHSKVSKERQAVTNVERDIDREYQLKHQCAIDTYNAKLEERTASLNEVYPIIPYFLMSIY